MAAKLFGLTAFASIAAATLAICGPAHASAPAEIRITLKNHRFEPSAFTVPAGQKVRVTLINRDAASEEFDSDDLHVEEDVTPMGRTSFNIGPLQAGQYSFMGELHSDTAQGAVTALSPGQ